MKYKVMLKYEVALEVEVEANGSWGLDRAIDNLIELGLDNEEGSKRVLLTDVDYQEADL